MSKPKLYYFDAAGRGDLIRLAFYIGGIPFEDIRIPRDVWATDYKPKAPSGQVPYLELPDGTTITESLACCMYASTMAGLVPECAMQAALANQAVGVLFEATSSRLFRKLFEADGEANRPIVLETVRNELMCADKIIAKTMGPGGYTVGSELSFADVVIYTCLHKALPRYLPELTPAVIEQIAPSLAKICYTTSQHPKVAAFYA